MDSSGMPIQNSINENDDISIRRMPHPYKAMLAICSDLDGTPNGARYLEIARYLNTKENTNLGPGLGIEVGNSIYFDMPGGQFSYWNTDDAGREMIRAQIQSGHIDCLHSYGDLSTTRARAASHIEELEKYDCRLEVWVDHATAPTNFGEDIMQGFGDVSAAKAYHADITYDFGIRYVWRGRTTSVIGQDVLRQLSGLWHPGHPVVSCKTLAKEFLKWMIARVGNKKYAMHGPNKILRNVKLRSGHPVFEFMRSNPHWGGVSCGATADGIADVFTQRMLDRLVDRQGVCILYTHLGKTAQPEEKLPADTRRGFETLAEYSRCGKILVATTRRILGYCRALRETKLSVSTEGGLFRIAAEYAGPKKDLDGLTFYIPENVEVLVVVNKNHFMPSNTINLTARVAQVFPCCGNPLNSQNFYSDSHLVRFTSKIVLNFKNMDRIFSSGQSAYQNDE